MSDAEMRMREIYAQELDRDGETLSAMLWREGPPAHPGSANDRIVRAMLAAEAEAIETFRETFADSNELLRQAMNALGTVDNNDPMEPIADNGMTVWDGMRAESKRLWALYRKHIDDRNAIATAIRSLKEGASHVG